MAKEFPKGRTAVLVIHGVGQQNPFDTLDSFTRGLFEHLRRDGLNVSLSHRLAHRCAARNLQWVESFVRLQNNLKGNDAYIDIHEYYWAHLTEEKIHVSDVWGWLDQTIRGARRFAKQNDSLVDQYEKQARSWKWLKLLISAWVWLRIPLRMSRKILSWFPRIHSLVKIADWIVDMDKLLVGYVGDVAIYTTTDAKSKHYRIRQQILAEALELLDLILQDSEYDQVLIVGHSLGSVIAYDMLNRLNVRSNANCNLSEIKKISGLITFGSPLDKIALFFREHSGEQQYVRRQIVGHLHSFRAKAVSQENNSIILENPIKPQFDSIRWVNYYDAADPISGHLDFYKIDENVGLTMGAPWGVAHVRYWDHKPFYQHLTRTFLYRKNSSTASTGSPN